MYNKKERWPSAKTSSLQAHNSFWHCLGKLSLNFSFQAAAELFSVCIQHSNSSTQPNTEPSVTSLHGTYSTGWFHFTVLVIVTPSFSHLYFLFMLLLLFCLLAVHGNTVQKYVNPTIAQDIAYLLLCNTTTRSWNDCPRCCQICNKNQIQQCST